jgi:hypothetical protein
LWIYHERFNCFYTCVCDDTILYFLLSHIDPTFSIGLVMLLWIMQPRLDICVGNLSNRRVTEQVRYKQRLKVSGEFQTYRVVTPHFGVKRTLRSEPKVRYVLWSSTKCVMHLRVKIWPQSALDRYICILNIRQVTAFWGHKY